jgi:hypothetical protein
MSHIHCRFGQDRGGRALRGLRRCRLWLCRTLRPVLQAYFFAGALQCLLMLANERFLKYAIHHDYYPLIHGWSFVLPNMTDVSTPSDMSYRMT